MTTETTPAVAPELVTVTSDQLENRLASLQTEATALMTHFSDRGVSAHDAVTVMAIVQTRVCASLGETRQEAFAGLQEMIAGLFEASKQDFDGKPADVSVTP